MKHPKLPPLTAKLAHGWRYYENNIWWRNLGAGHQQLRIDLESKPVSYSLFNGRSGARIVTVTWDELDAEVTAMLLVGS